VQAVGVRDDERLSEDQCARQYRPGGIFAIMSSEVHAIAPEWQRRLRVDEYHQMIEAGIFDEDEHVELLHGMLVLKDQDGSEAHAEGPGAHGIAPEWQRRLRVDEYHQMIEAGIFDEDEHVELLHGILVAMSPQGPRHARIIEHLTWALQRALGDAYRVRVQLPLTLADSEPEPDIAVVAAGATDPDRHPDCAILVIEVAGGSLRRDRDVKTVLYARAGIPEYWIVNVDTHAIEVYRDPDREAGSYGFARVASEHERISPLQFPDLVIALSELFGS
jgi:Uma2 family endonuclease